MITTDPVQQEKPEKLRKFGWWWPGTLATSLAGAVFGVFRGCWHGKMSWPVAVQGYSYQVCLSCGAMRLFDEKTFRSFGPFRYDLAELIAWQKSTKPMSRSVEERLRPVR